MGNFSERLTHLPVKPGVYLMKDKSGKIIYIGKASVIRNRVRSYFQKKANLPPKIPIPPVNRILIKPNIEIRFIFLRFRKS